MILFLENLCLRNSMIFSFSLIYINNFVLLVNDGVILMKEMYCVIIDCGFNRVWL